MLTAPPPGDPKPDIVIARPTQDFFKLEEYSSLLGGKARILVGALIESESPYLVE